MWPGTISVGLAKAVAPGELHGIDMEEPQIEMARAAAAAGGHENAAFRIGDVTDLPYDDASFDVVHCHALLTHVPDTQAVLAEAKRVLKPGGVVSARELLGNAWFMEPEIGFGGAWETFMKLLAANGGHPSVPLANTLVRQVGKNAFAVIQPARPCPVFGRPIRHGVAPSTTARYFSASPSDSTSRWTPCPPVVSRQ